MSSWRLTGVRDESSSILHSTYATLDLSISFSLWAGLRGAPTPPGPSFYLPPYLLTLGLFCQRNVGKMLVMNERFVRVDGAKLRELRRRRMLSLRDQGARR